MRFLPGNCFYVLLLDFEMSEECLSADPSDDLPSDGTSVLGEILLNFERDGKRIGRQTTLMPGISIIIWRDVGRIFFLSVDGVHFPT
jgi:hypothetical protein